MPKKNQEEDVIEVRPKWMKPADFKKPEQQQRQQWQNPNRMTYRERMDRRLERAGLLDYQTEGLSPEEIAQRYATANIKISDRSSWFKDNYGFEAPETITNREAMQAWRKQAFEGNAQSIFPTVPIETPKQVIPSGGNADRPQNFMQASNGLLVRAPKTQPTDVAESPVASKVFATNEQALNGEVNWTDLSSTEREKMLKDPTFYTSGQITKYPAWMQQQILGDKNFDWNRLPAWQRTYYDLSSSPGAMGAVQGGLMGLGSGNAFGAPVGAALGWAAGKSGYDQTKEFWKQDNLTAGAFGLMNWLAEQAEKGVGVIAQSAAILTGNDPNFDPKKRNLSWDAGASFAEVMGPAYQAALKADDKKFTADDILNRVPIVAMYRLYEVVSDPEKFKGRESYLGATSPIPLDKTWVERLNEAEKRINAGEDYRVVMTDLQTGVKAQISDMVFQAAADPLNVMPDTTNKILGLAADASGNKVAAEAFRSTEGPVEAGRKYRTLVQTGQALTIDPEFKVDQMGALSKFIAGVNDTGAVKQGSLIPTKKGLLDPVTGREFVVNNPMDILKGIVKDPIGLVKHLAEQTPHSRAQTGAGMFYENVSAMMQMFETPEEAAKYIGALSKSDMNTWAELGSRFAESPEFYTVLPALKEFKGSLDGIVQTWEMSAPNRDLLTRIADIMGDQPGNVLEDLARKGTAEQDYQRLMERLQEIDTPTAKALLADAEAGRFTAETLKQMIDVFTGEGALPWHPGQWKAMMLDQLGDHFDQWVTQRLMLDKSPEAVSAFFRTSALMKQAQSILLLGGSPGYAITNGLSNMVHRAVSGVFGYMTGKQIDTFLDRFGMTPARFDEGVGIGGVVEQAAGKSGVKTSTMDEAVKGKGPLTTAKDALAKISKGMPFSKLSSLFERNEGRQAFSIAMRDAWSQSWRRGVGFREMSPELVRVLNEMGTDPRRIYAAIEAGMNQTEIENVLMGRRAEVQARSLIHDAAEKTGMSASEAAQMLERIGILDTLDTFLAGQTTRDGVTQAFARAERVAQDWMDMRTGEDLKARAENVKQRVGLEGATAALDVAQKAHAEFTDAWMDHYYRFGEVMQNLFELDDTQRDKALDLAYDVSDKEFRRVDATNAANWQGVFEAWGLSGDVRALRMLEGMGEVGAAMSGAYRQMRENFKAWREKWANDPTNPARWDELTAVRGANDALFKKAFKAKHDAEVKMGAAMAEIYEAQHGPAAGEAARRWWEDVVAFNDEIVKRERDFRGEMAQAARAGVPAELIAVQKQKYYSETKILLIAELEKINSDGIARLERVIRGRGTSNEGQGRPTPPTDGGGWEGLREEFSRPYDAAQNARQRIEERLAAQARDVSGETATVTSETQPPTPPVGEGSRVDPADEVNALMSAAEQRKGREKAEKKARESAVWDVAEEYWGKGGNYNRGILQDGFALVNALRKAEYGGIPDLTWLDDPRLTPELARQILETRKAAKETSATAAAEQAFTVTEKNRGRKFDTSQINNDTTILRAVALHGGLDMNLRLDITGEKKPKGVPGLFTKDGVNIDVMARMLADDGYPIDVNRADDPGGVNQARELINRARNGDKVYPVGHDFSAEIDAAEAAWIEGFNFDEVPETPFDSALWQSEFAAAVERADLVQVYEMIGTFPDEILEQPSAISGQTWRDYLSRVADEVAIRADENARAESVAARAAEVQETLTAAEQHAEAVTKRTILMESLAEAFKLDEKKMAAYGEMSDALADWYARITGETRDDFYNRYFGDVKRGGADAVDGLLQSEAAPVWYSKLERTVESMPQDVMTVEQLRGAITKAGVKADELYWTGFDEWVKGRTGKVSKADALAFLREGGVKVEEVYKGGDGERSRYEGYQIPGGENYQELLFTLPTDMTAPKVSLPDGYKVEELYGHRTAKYTLVGPDGTGRPIPGDTYQDALVSAYRNIYGFDFDEKGTYRSGHWDEPNVLAHTRFNERVDVDGKKVLFIEEVQSDWHQSGREKGYRDPSLSLKAEGYARSLREKYRLSFDENIVGNPKVPMNEQYELSGMNIAKNSGVPNAPFAKTWHELVMKRMLRYAAENGFDKVAWTTGEMQAARYDLSKQVERVEYFGNSRVEVYGHDGSILLDRPAKPEELPDIIGKEAAEKLLKQNTEPTATNEKTKRVLSGAENLKVGGEGMKGFYDQILPSTMDKYAKKWGAKTGETLLGASDRDVYAFHEMSKPLWDDLSPAEKDILRAEYKKQAAKVHSLEVTPAMRESVMQGQPLFQKDKQAGLWGAGEDTPLFSGTAQKAKAETYKPTEAGKQETMFDMRPQFGTGEASLAPKIPGTIDKGMVTFEEMKATITAFEAADFSTVIHESGHVYRRVLADVAERTGNPYILRDLQTIEEWAGVTDGKWTREAEEKFARGFERYITEGNAPTPKLVQAFESFRQWMLDIYKSITGSSIDVKLTDDVRRVFDRMLGQEEQVAAGFDPETQWVDTNGRVHMKQRADLGVDSRAAKADARALMEGDMGARLKAAAEARRARANPTPSPSPSLRDGEGSGTLFQSEVPFGMYDEKAQFRPASDGMDATWRERVMPLLRAMEEGAKDQVSAFSPTPSPSPNTTNKGVFGEGGFRDMSPEGQAMLRKYMAQVKGDMATTKLATVRFAEKQRDFALLNYSKRYGYDRMGDFLATYQLYPTRSGVTWLARAVDKPALFSNYARLRMQQERYERDIPERLRGKIRISAPWLPEWAGDSLYIDPMRNLFFPDTVARYLERGQREKNYQVIEAERVLQEWQASGQYNDAEIIDAAKTQKGKVWERAWAEAQMRRESESSNPVDFFTSFFGPSWYLSTPLNLAGVRVPGISQGKPEKVNTLPLGNTARALDTVTQGTWAEPVGNLIGLIGKGEDAIRETFKLPTRGEYAEYYAKRQVANMVAEGKISPEDAQIAMIEKTGPIWDEAKQRVDMELALRVPLAGVTYAALQEGPLAGAQAAVPSLFGASLLPAGELEYRGLKDEWNEAWKLADAGDTKAVQRFFDNYPEYEAWLAKNKDDGELLKSFLIGQIWDAYMELGDTNQKQARAELGEGFRQSFLDKETRSYETLDVNQLVEWARLLGAKTPSVAGATPPPTSSKLGEEDPKLQLYPEQVTGITDQFFEQRRNYYPNYYEQQSAYYALPKSDRMNYLAENPDYAEYRRWKDRWYKSYPQFVPIFNGDAFDRVDTSGWMPGLEDAVREAAMSGGRLGQGARAALMNEWLLAGQPMNDFDTWVKSAVLPGMMYGD